MTVCNCFVSVEVDEHRLDVSSKITCAFLKDVYERLWHFQRMLDTYHGCQRYNTSGASYNVVRIMQMALSRNDARRVRHEASDDGSNHYGNP
jgi:hypothetical protein